MNRASLNDHGGLKSAIVGAYQPCDRCRRLLHRDNRILRVGVDDPEVINYDPDTLNLGSIFYCSEALLKTGDITGEGDHAIGRQNLDSRHLHAAIVANPVLYVRSNMATARSTGTTCARECQQAKDADTYDPEPPPQHRVALHPVSWMQGGPWLPPDRVEQSKISSGWLGSGPPGPGLDRSQDPT
jgi:hypothetical protein